MTAELKTVRDQLHSGEVLATVGFLAVGEPPPNRAAPDRAPILSEIRMLAARARDVVARSPTAVFRNPSEAPLIYVTADGPTLDALASSGAVYQLELDPGPGTPLSAVWRATVGADVATAAGWDGTGRLVALLEGGQPDNYSALAGVAAIASSSGYADFHMTMTAGLVREAASPYGTVPSVGILVANWDMFPGSGTVQQWALNNGADVINFSWSFSNGSDGGLSATDLYHDWLVLQSPYSLFTSAAGNGGNNSNSALQFIQNRSYNTIIVGASDDNATSGRGDDIIDPGSSWRNHTTTNGDRELPEIAAPGQCVDTTAYSCGNLTSAAAPIVAGAVAAVRHRNPFNLMSGNWPEAQKAILMASADCDISGVRLNLTDATDDRDGVGLLNLSRAVGLADPNNANFGTTATTRGFRYGSMTFSTDFTSSVWNVAPRVQTDATGWIAIVLAWDATPSCSTPSSCSGSGPDADLNLLLYNDATSTLVASSASFDNNYEVIIQQLSASTTYRVNVVSASTRTASTYYGLAWATFASGCPNPTL